MVELICSLSPIGESGEQHGSEWGRGECCIGRLAQPSLLLYTSSSGPSPSSFSNLRVAGAEMDNSPGGAAAHCMLPPVPGGHGPALSQATRCAATSASALSALTAHVLGNPMKHLAGGTLGLFTILFPCQCAHPEHHPNWKEETCASGSICKKSRPPWKNCAGEER